MLPHDDAFITTWRRGLFRVPFIILPSLTKTKKDMLKKGLTILVACSMLNMSVFAASPLSRGSSVLVRTTTSISSKKSKSQNAAAIVDADVKSIDGRVVIKAGTPVELQIDAHRARGCGRAGWLSVSCVSTTAVDGQRISLNGNMEAEGDSKKGAAIGWGVGLGLTLLPFVGFAFFAIKGHNAQIKANTLVNNTFVSSDYEIQ